MCSYSCNICNGAEWRCGTGNKNCGCGGYGSKYCWEENVILELKTKKNPIIIKGVYDGYGRLHVSDRYKNLGKNIYWEKIMIYLLILMKYMIVKMKININSFVWILFSKKKQFLIQM